MRDGKKDDGSKKHFRKAFRIYDQVIQFQNYADFTFRSANLGKTTHFKNNTESKRKTYQDVSFRYLNPSPTKC